MARQARAVSSKGLYYVELNGERLFITPSDKEKFLNLSEERFADGGKIYGCVLSDTSVRMVVKESAAGISAVMKSLKIMYARYFNRANNLTGKVFAGRFKSVPLESVKEAEETAENLSAAPIKKPAASVKKPAAPKAKSAAQKAKPEVPEKPTAVEKPVSRKKNLPSWLL